MSEYHHPMRDLTLHIFQNMEADGAPYIARFFPYDAVPMFFQGATISDAREKAESFRANAIERHETNSIVRQEALAKAREARKNRKSA